ncbi:MAG TPA: oligosaccharide flippase family protein [Candidatus Limnocylindria bacterium]
MLARARQHSGGLYLFVATSVANVLGFGYQIVMARLLRPEEYAVLTALFGILILESISSQVIQSATAKLTAQYRARDEEAALHAFVRRWAGRVGGGAAAVGVLVALLSGVIAGALELPVLSVALLGLTLFLALVFTFGLGLLQGLARFVWMGSALIAQAGSRLAVGVVLVLTGLGVDGAFTGATCAIAISLVVVAVPLVPLFRAARGSRVTHELGLAETRFFALSAVVLLAYAALTNIDAVLARSLLRPEDAGAYAGAITMGKIVLFAPMAIGFLLLERTARAHARGEDTDRALYLALAFVLATSGLVAVAYILLPEFLVPLVVGSQYPDTAKVVGTYGVAALANALLSQWISYFIGRGEMRVGLLLAAAVAAELVLLLTSATDPLAMARIVLVVAIATQIAAVATFIARKIRPG